MDTFESPFRNVPDSPTQLPPDSPTQLPLDSPTQLPPSGTKNRNSFYASKIGISITIVIVGLLVIIFSVTILFLRRRKKKKQRMPNILNQDEIDNLEGMQYGFGVIKHATHDFKDDNKLGEGGFGTVYKGVLSNGSEIAVKRVCRSSGREGDIQLKNEIMILAKLKHKNLVRLLGFCLHEKDVLLVYEVVANSSLDRLLFDPIRRESMMWETRFKIINGTARGLLYLHEESRLRIIHRDLKAANILLDIEFNPKIADFGMARLFDLDQTGTMTSKVIGTLGYMAPEYLFYGQMSTKSDVFSFGVVVLEIISGKNINSFMDGENEEDLLCFAWRNWMNDSAWNIVDNTLSTSFSIEILRCIHIGLLCVQENPVDRPTMSSTAFMLGKHACALPVPSPPAFYMDNISTPNSTLKEYLL